MSFNENFFKEIALILQKYEMLKSQSERFNIFSALHTMHEEKRLHSRFIAALMDPFGSHDLKYAFLYEFLLNEGLEVQNYKNALVYPQELDKREEADIDILIIDREAKNAIIIENKILAGDSNNGSGGQLERYFKYILHIERIPQENIKVFYLTPNGRQPSPKSLGEFKDLVSINGKCITYPKEIIKWLDKCLVHTIDKPFLKECILQYKKLINIMTQNDSSIEERIELRNKIGENETNLKSTKYLIDNFKHIKWHTVNDFWKELENQLESAGFKIVSMPNEADITNLTHFEEYKKGQKEKQAHGMRFSKDNLSIWIWHSWDRWLFWGIEDNDDLSEDERVKFKTNSKLKYVDDEYYTGWEKDCFEDDNEKIYLSDFSYDATFNLINAQNRRETVRKIIGEIMELLE